MQFKKLSDSGLGRKEKEISESEPTERISYIRPGVYFAHVQPPTAPPPRLRNWI